MLPDLRAREIELKTKLYEAELHRDFLLENYTKEELATRARVLVLANLAKRLDLSGRLSLYQDNKELNKTDLVELTEELTTAVDGALDLARSPVLWTQPEQVLGRFLDVTLGREAFHALQILARANDLEEFERADPFAALETDEKDFTEEEQNE